MLESVDCRDMNEIEFVSIGDSTIDVFLEVDGGHVATSDGENPQFCVESGSKIGVKKKTRIAAVGNSANNAIGSSRLGLKTAIYTHIGDDADGREMMEVFKSEGVVTDFINFDPGKGSNFSTVINYGAE